MTAEIHETTLTPTKPELVQGWIGSQPWYRGSEPSLSPAGAYRIVDPAGEVGIETLLLRDADGTLYQVPVTYRSEPLPGAELIGTIEHGVLGTRYVTLGTTDAVYVTEMIRTIVEGRSEAALSSGKEPTARVHGSGAPADESYQLEVIWTPTPGPAPEAIGTLEGEIVAEGELMTLVVLR